MPQYELRLCYLNIETEEKRFEHKYFNESEPCAHDTAKGLVKLLEVECFVGGLLKYVPFMVTEEEDETIVSAKFRKINKKNDEKWRNIAI